MISTAKMQARKEERRALLARAKAGDTEAARILEREHGTKVYIGAAAEAIAPPVKVPFTTTKRRNAEMPNRWGAPVEVPKDLGERFAAAIERSGKKKKDVAGEIRCPDGKSWGYTDMFRILKGEQRTAGEHLVAAIEAWIANAPESAPPGGAPEAAPPATRAREPKPPGRPRRPSLPGPEERQPTREERSLPATVPAAAPATGLQEALAAVSALLGPSQGPDDGRRRVKIVLIEVVL